MTTYAAPELDSPHLIMRRLAEIEQDLAVRQNAFERAAAGFYATKREQERERARALLSSEEASVTARKASGDLAAHALDGGEHEAEYEALKAVIRVLETRASVLQSLLRIQGRA